MLSVIAGLILSTQLQVHQPQVPEIVYSRTPIVTSYRASASNYAANQNSAQAAGGTIKVTAGDRRISQSLASNVAKIIDQTSLRVIQDSVGTTPAEKTNVVLYSSTSSYGKALISAGVPVSQVMIYATGTAGITMGSEVWIPLYNIANQGDLENVLTHELTHVAFNQMGIGDKLPTWINEGMAMRNGTNVYLQVDRRSALLYMLTQQAGILSAVKGDQLLPLTASEEDIMTADYNVEYEDYLAVQSLINKYGVDRFVSFFNDLKTEGLEQAFQNSFGVSMSIFQDDFYRGLMGQSKQLAQ